MTGTALGSGDRSRTHQIPTDATQLAQQAAQGLSAIEHATVRLMEVADSLDERAIRQPSLLPGWTRAHVLSHLARNADACVNLLRWARTGVEQRMYASVADREAGIVKGAERSHRLLVEDLAAACSRFAGAAQALPASGWAAEVVNAQDTPIPALKVLRARLMEVWTHLVDLDCGFEFADIPIMDVERLLEESVQRYGGRPDVPAVSITVTLPNGRSRTWELRATTSRPREVRGDPPSTLSWLLGRSGGERLSGDVPELPVWL